MAKNRNAKKRLNSVGPEQASVSPAETLEWGLRLLSGHFSNGQSYLTLVEQLRRAGALRRTLEPLRQHARRVRDSATVNSWDVLQRTRAAYIQGGAAGTSRIWSNRIEVILSDADELLRTMWNELSILAIPVAKRRHPLEPPAREMQELAKRCRRASDAVAMAMENPAKSHPAPQFKEPVYGADLARQVNERSDNLRRKMKRLRYPMGGTARAWTCELRDGIAAVGGHYGRKLTRMYQNGELRRG